jgi:hypothetical protein
MQRMNANGANARRAGAPFPSSSRAAARAAALRAIAHQPHQSNSSLPGSSDRHPAAPTARAPNAQPPQAPQSAIEIATRAVNAALAAPEHLRKQMWQQQQAQAILTWRQQQRAASGNGAARGSSGNSEERSGNGDVPSPTARKRGTDTYVPWRDFASQPSKRARTDGPPGLLLLAAPWERPPGWTPTVHGLRAAPKELERRAIEALRIAPIVPMARWVTVLDEPDSSLRRWPPMKLRTHQLDAICAMAGHDRLAAFRRHIVNLDAFCVNEFGSDRGAVLGLTLGSSRLKAYCIHRNETHDIRAAAAAATKHARGAAQRSGASESGASHESGAAAAALSALSAVAKCFDAPWNTEHRQLDQFRGRPPAREDGGAPPFEVGMALHHELGALDASLPETERDCHALARLQGEICAREALSKRSRTPRRVENGMAVGAAGMDLKKGKWRTEGRPLVASVHGYLGSTEWFDRAVRVLDAGDFNTRVKSLLRMHNGRDGDVTVATGFLDREPNDHEWNEVLRQITARNVHVRKPDGAWEPITPHLVTGGGARQPTKHSYKKAKISAYLALRLHPDYAVEPGAHAGSAMERMSVNGATAAIRNTRPRGLGTALRYARAAYSPEAVMEVEMTVAKAIRAWVASVGVSGVPRAASWSAITSWVTDDLSRHSEQPDASPSLLPMRTVAPDPPLTERAEQLA